MGKNVPDREAHVRGAAGDDSIAPAKKFEVRFRGRVSVENNNTPPSLIDECVDWLALDGGPDLRAKPLPRTSDHTMDLAKVATQIRLLFQPTSRAALEKAAWVREAATTGSRLSSPPRGQETAEHRQGDTSCSGLTQPTLTVENRPVLLMVGRDPHTQKQVITSTLHFPS